MANSSFIRKILSISPHIEMIVRRLYWSNNKFFSKKARKVSKIEKMHLPSTLTPFNYKALEQHLRSCGVDTGSLLVVHSSFSALAQRTNGPEEMIDFLLQMVGTEGTLLMPAMPLFRNARPVSEYLTGGEDESVYVYDLQRSRVKTGVLPAAMCKRAGSVRSRHPINSMVAIGKAAEQLMQGNLSGDSPLACGVNSSWQRCVEQDAIIVGIGTDLTHSLTMIHVAEDVKDSQWPVKNWYREKRFLVKDHDFEENYVLRERDPRWGALHFAERTLCKDLIAENLLKSHVVDDVLIETLSARKLIHFLNTRNPTGYPYYWLNL